MTTVQTAAASRLIEQQNLSEQQQAVQRARINEMINQKNIENQAQYQRQLQKYTEEMKNQGFKPVYSNGQLTGFEHTEKGISVPLQNIPSYIAQYNAKIEQYNKVQKAAEVKALQPPAWFGPINTPSVATNLQNMIPSERLAYEAQKMVETVEKARIQAQRNRQATLSSNIANFLIGTGEQTILGIASIPTVIEHPITTTQALAKKIGLPAVGEEKTLTKALTKGVKTVPPTVAALALVGSTSYLKSFQERPYYTLGQTFGNIAPLFIGPKFTKTITKTEEVADTVNFISKVTKARGEGEFIIRTQAKVGNNIQIVKELTKQLERGSVSKGYGFNFERINNNELRVTAFKTVGKAAEIEGVSEIRTPMVLINPKADNLIDAIMPIHYEAEKVLISGKGVVAKAYTKDIAEILYQENPITKASRFVKGKATKKAEWDVSDIFGITTPSEPKIKIPGIKAYITPENPLDNILDFMGTYNPKYGVNIKGKIIISGEESNTMSELLVGGGKQRLAEIQKLAVKSATRGAKVRQVTTTTTKLSSPVEILERSLISATPSAKMVQPKQKTISPSTSISNLLTSETQKVSQIQEQPQRTAQYPISRPRQTTYIETADRLANLLAPAIRQKLNQQQKQEEKLRELYLLEQIQVQRQRAPSIRTPRQPLRYWGLIPESEEGRRGISRRKKGVEKRRKGKYKIKPTVTQEIYGLSLPRNLELKNLTGFEILRI